MDKKPFYEMPCALPVVTSYRYRVRYGWIMIGADSHAAALREAQRSTRERLVSENLQVWNGTEYVKAEW